MYFPQLDVLRFIAFLMVFGAHAFPHDAGALGGGPFAGSAAVLVRSGGFGVDLFFALSSFLITSLLLREREQTGRLDVKSFYIRRALRIWPLYFAFLIGGFGLQFVAPSKPLSGADFAAFALFLGNWKIAFAGYPADAFALLWSLCVEEQFYFLWPPVIRLTSGASLRTVAVGMIVTSVLSRLVFSIFDLPDYSFWCATISRLDPIAVGILVAVGGRPIREHAYAAVFFGFAIVVLGEAIDTALPQYGRTFGYLVVAGGCGLVLSGFLAMKAQPGLLSYLGKISFGLYVFHRAILDLGLYLFPTHSAALQLARAGLCLALSITAAALSYELYEAPFLKVKNRFAHVASRPV